MAVPGSFDVRALQAALAAVTSGVVVLDATGAVVHANEAALRILGLTLDQLLGRTARDPRWQAIREDGTALMTPEHPGLAAVQSGRPQRDVVLGVAVPPERERRWLQADAIPLLDGDGATSGAVVTFRDITEQRRAEEALRTSEQRFRTLMEEAPIAISIKDASGRYEAVNPAYCSLYGYSQEELLGQSLTVIFPEDRQARMAEQHAAHFDAGRSGGEYEARTKDGRAVYVATASIPLPDLDSRRLRASFTVDITARKREQETQARLAAIVASCEDAIIAKSLEGIIESWNLGAERLYGYSAEEVIGRHIDMLAPADRHQEIASIMARLGRGEPIPTFETVRVRKDGSAVDVSLSISPIKDAAGRAIGVSTVARDVGERVCAEREAERARAAAEDLARLRNDLVTAISHELRTPLTVIVGVTEMLQVRWPELSDGARLEKVTRIAAAAGRQSQLVADLLLLSRIEGDALLLNRAVEAVAPLARRAVAAVQATYGGQRIEVTGPERLSALVDGERVLQVLINLLDNAAKHSQVGSAIEISWAAEADAVVVRVRDRGLGIPEESRPQLFTRFGRVPGSGIRAGRVGTGLGLYLSRELARAMGGELELEATGPDGSTFRLVLPAADIGRTRAG